MSKNRGERGYQWRQPAVDPTAMERICRRLASDLRAEHVAGMGSITLTGDGGKDFISREEAARRMDEQGDRWKTEASGGARNDYDRALIGFP